MRRLTACAGLLAFGVSAEAGFETPVPPDDLITPIDADEWQCAARVRAFVGYDTNVQYYNDFLMQPDTEGFLGGITLYTSAERRMGSGFSIGGAFRGDLIGYTGGDNDTYNHYTIQPSVFVKHQRQLAGGTDVTLLGAYSFTKTQAKDWEGIDSNGHQLVAKSTFDVPGPLAFFVAGTLAVADYDIFAGDPLSDRDGVFGEIAAGASYDVMGVYLRKLSGRIGFQKNDADGENWSYEGFIVAGEADFHIFGPLHGTVGASYASRDYVGDFTSQGFTPPGRENQQVTTLTGRLIWYITPTHTADLGIKHEIVDSNSDEFTGSKTAVTAGLTIKLK
jgi:hypothetical protein